jgi:hypothetical protein
MAVVLTRPMFRFLGAVLLIKVLQLLKEAEDPPVWSSSGGSLATFGREYWL